MANLTQTDYDGASGIAAQLQGGKRTAGAFINKLVRSYAALPGTSTTTPFQINYQDNSSEVLYFDAATIFWCPGAGLTVLSNTGHNAAAVYPTSPGT